MFNKYIQLLVLAASAVLAERPLCIESGRSNPYQQAISRTVEDGRTLAFCWNPGSALTVDNNWVTDIGAILTTLVQTGNSARCVDCLPSAQPAGCTGYSTIWNIDANIAFGDIPPPLDNYSKDVFMDLIKQAAAEGVQMAGWGKDFDPVLTIDKPGQFREQSYYINGDGDTC